MCPLVPHLVAGALHVSASVATLCRCSIQCPAAFKLHLYTLHQNQILTALPTCFEQILMAAALGMQRSIVHMTGSVSPETIPTVLEWHLASNSLHRMLDQELSANKEYSVSNCLQRAWAPMLLHIAKLRKSALHADQWHTRLLLLLLRNC